MHKKRWPPHVSQTRIGHLLKGGIEFWIELEANARETEQRIYMPGINTIDGNGKYPHGKKTVVK